jgi:hypothetical protein
MGEAARMRLAIADGREVVAGSGSYPFGTLVQTPPAVTDLRGPISAVTQLLTSPASGAPCAHWRLRIFETVAPGLELVHEVVSPELLEVAWCPEPTNPARPLRISPNTATVEALPMCHRVGSPGALAVAKHFGLRGIVRVEEVLVRHGEAVEVTGFVYDPSPALSRGPFRTVDTPAELMHAVIRLDGPGLRPTLVPALLPWAFGTAAALFGAAAAVAVVTEAVRHLAPLSAAAKLSRPIAPAVGPAKIPHPRWP